MGNIINNLTRDDSLLDYAELRQELSDLYTKVDRNNDNIVTKDEMDEWSIKYKDALAKNKKKIKIIQNQFKERLAAKETEINDLHSELKTEQHNNAQLKQQLDTLLEHIDTGNIDPDELESVISSAKINHYVDEILANEGINIKGFPDAIEKAIYKNVFKIILLVLAKLTEKVDVDILGHNLRLIVH